MLLISNADQYIGHCITSHLAYDPNIRSQLRVLCQNLIPCKQFMNQDIDVHQVDYHHPHQLSVAMRNVDHLVLVIGDNKDRVIHAKRLCQVALRSGIKSIILVSHVGALCSNLTSSLSDFALVENEIYNADCAWTILRCDWIQQYFHLWTTYTEKNRSFPLPMDATTEFCPIDILDVCESVASLLLLQQKNNITKIVDALDDQHIGQVYTLTGPRMINGKKLMKSLINATHYSSYRFLQVRPMDLQYYLKYLPKDIWFDARLKRDRYRMHYDDFGSYSYRSNIFGPPSDLQIQTFLDYFNWIFNTSSSICIPHVRLLTGKTPRSLDAFFKENANSFKPRV
ncbi:uncharacterized protein BX664DRAFT_327983 [Halteromyces radiatus]|uniref:uncharacterized protein n=1 Tax=Halteromyces radiatus TaxID=101107 RepID=UPI0022207BE2|nr:uncharacterized protein BX664DRAFT_327983 [Halteromyces radiatus]KAI8092728.1 hypothetical protein BX664DRAFT_327983 [Halteromyces radiatus]